MFTRANTEVHNVDKVSSIAHYLHRKLVDMVGDRVERFRDDLLIHDLNAISQMSNFEFIHVSHSDGTHIYEIPRTIDDNSKVPYLFGEKRPSSIYTDVLELLKTFFGRPEFFGYEHVYVYCDGKKLRVLTKDEAVSIYQGALTRVLRELRYGSSMPGVQA